jgi:glycosyltransferase involved in cell wall biosynthesis
MPAQHAAITIVSKNYLAQAKVLATTYRRHHPDHDFIVILVDRMDGYEYDLGEGVDLVEMSELKLPDFGSFVHRYSVMELNTAVKPYALHRMFAERGYETLLYIDPDIKIYSPLVEVQKALSEANIALIPHMRRPFHDADSPAETNILQSGTYNLGFLGLRRSETAESLLSWWMGKLFLDCIVDIPNGLFVDQKWMDLVPGYYPDHRLIHHPGYNIAYWNLHERDVSRAEDGEGWLVDGQPLAFFHFSGYSPLKPDVLSKHQSRHDFRHVPEVKSVFDDYAKDLLAADYAKTVKQPYAYAKLPSGLKPPTFVRDIIQGLLRANVVFPDPLKEPEAFCRFLLTPGTIPGDEHRSALVHFLFKRRPDVANAFPGGHHNPFDRDLQGWMVSNGDQEEGLGEIVRFSPKAIKPQTAKYVLDTLDHHSREDVYGYYAQMWWDDFVFDGLIKWVKTYGAKELALSDAQADAFSDARDGIVKVLNLYFMRGDLQREFTALEEPRTLGDFCNWLSNRRTESNFSSDEIALFRKFVQRNPEHVARMRFLYQHFGEPFREGASLFDAAKRAREIDSTESAADLVKWLVDQDDLDIASLIPDDDTPGASRRAGRDIPGLTADEKDALVAKAAKRRRAIATEDWINFAGFLHAKTGVGESSRGNLEVLRAAGRKINPVVLPSLTPEGLPPRSDLLFGWPVSGARASFTVANADAVKAVQNWLPGTFWAERNIGYWVWETEQLPHWQGLNGDEFTEIWTPSTYSAEAIRAATSTPVHVLPHVLDFAGLDDAASDRERFGLPAGKTLYGFVFDPKSVLERKNVMGLIKAFRAAIRPGDDAALVLKSSDRVGYSFDYEMVKAEADGETIVFVEQSLDRAGTNAFIKSLDVYISLHRAEGFGLTCAEAMAVGIPTIATGYSGNLEFMTADNSLLVPAKTIRTERPFGPYPRGTVWGDPDQEAAVDAIRKMLDADARAALGAKGKASVRKSLSLETLAGRARALLEQGPAAKRSEAAA